MSSNNAQVLGVVVFYIFAALSLIFANKWVLNNTSVPLFFLLTQLILASILFILAHTLSILPKSKSGLPSLTLSPKTTKALMPMILLNVIGLSLTTSTLKHLDASFYQVARGLVLPLTVLLSALSLSPRRIPSTPILVSCAFVTTGFFTGIFLDGTPLSTLGIVCGALSSLVTALHSIVIKKSLDVQGINGSAIVLSWYMNAVSSFLLIPVVLFVGEGSDVVELLAKGLSTSEARAFWVGSFITGTLGFLMSIASLLSIKVTSPITHMVSSAVRGVAQSLLGVWLFGDIVTTCAVLSSLGSPYLTLMFSPSFTAVALHQ